MSTYRERREARADRLREWAEKREIKAAEAYEESSRMASVIPFGQPIIVGHYSERSDRRYRDRIGRKMDQSCEHSAKAADMESRAANIDAQNAQAIYSDDPDARERLVEKIAKLEAERDHYKQINAAWRKEHRAELKTMTAYERDMAQPVRGYVGTNLSGNISRLRKRLEALDRPPADRMILARFDSNCADCGAELKRGQQIRYNKQQGARCVECEES